MIFVGIKMKNVIEDEIMSENVCIFIEKIFYDFLNLKWGKKCFKKLKLRTNKILNNNNNFMQIKNTKNLISRIRKRKGKKDSWM